jgi:TRAP-type C4-dicarboxylate transport system permease small subunit
VTKVNEHVVQLTERIMAYALLVVIGLSVVSFFAIIIGTWNGMTAADFGKGLWPLVAGIPYVGLPLGILLILTIVVSSARRRSRAARESTR